MNDAYRDKHNGRRKAIQPLKIVFGHPVIVFEKSGSLPHYPEIVPG